MNKLENPTKCKHDHKWTDKLKVIIFALLMLAPLFSVLVKCIYTLNPNAKESYYGETINQKNYNPINDRTLLTINDQYLLDVNLNKLPEEGSGGNTRRIYYIPQEVEINTTQVDLMQTRAVGFYWANNQLYGYFFDENGQQVGNAITFSPSNPNEIRLKIKYISNTLVDNVILNKDILYQIEYINSSYLDNVFYYSVNQIKEEQLFNWVENTIVYNGLNAMNMGFGLTNNHVLTYLLAYWTILTAIYIIIDIILFLFTKLTHFLQ